MEPDHGNVIREAGVRVPFCLRRYPEDLSGSIRKVVTAGVLKDGKGDWECEHEVNKILSQMQLRPDVEVAYLSAGMKRRVLLANRLCPSPICFCWTNPQTISILIPYAGWRIF